MSTSNTFTKGLNQDSNPKFQPDSTYRFALNAVAETADGDLYTISNELGNLKEYYGESTFTNIILGHCVLDDTSILLCVKGDASKSFTQDAILLYNPGTRQIQILVLSDDLSFSLEHQINIIFKTRNNGERLVYFTDNHNWYRVLNVDYALQNAPLGDAYVPELPYTKIYTHPDITATAVVAERSGMLKYGTYSFYFRYLDRFENPINEWIEATNYVPIYYGGVTLNWNQFAASNNSESPYYKSTSDKSIYFQFTLDTSATNHYYQIAVVKRTSDDGTISGVDILYPQDIISSSQLFIYTGDDSEVLTQTSLDELLVPNQRIEKCVAHTIQDGRLYVANVLNTSRQYTDYQVSASKIQVNWEAVAITSDISNRPDLYFGNTDSYGFMPDEVYALGIVYIHSDGTESPVFHIPGRPQINNASGSFGTNPYITAQAAWDNEIITSSDANNIYGADTARWKLYNTATIQSGSTSSLAFGYMGYYEITNTYPEVVLCSGTTYWGKDYTNTDIVPNFTKIRHHKMPSEELMPLSGSYTSGRAYKIGLKFTGVDYPSTEIVGHYFVFGDRTFNKTVLDSGLIDSLWKDTNNDFGFHSPTTPDGVVVDGHTQDDRLDFTNESPASTFFIKNTAFTTFSFCSLNTVYNSKLPSGTYFKITRNLRESSASGSSYYQAPAVLHNNTYDTDFSIGSYIGEWNSYKRPTQLNFSITASKYLPKATANAQFWEQVDSSEYFIDSTTGVRIYNASNSLNVGILKFNTTIPDLTGTAASSRRFLMLYGTIKSDAEVFTNLHTIQYKKINSNPLDESYTGTLYNGDIFISKVTYFDNTNPNGSSSDNLIFLNSFTAHSDFNPTARYQADSEFGKYLFFQYGGFNYPHYLARRYFVHRKWYQPDSTTVLFYPELCEISPALNYKNSDKVYLPIPYNFDLCSTQREYFPIRIFYSEIDTLESRNDPNRIIRINNYRDITTTSGAITDLFLNRERMYVTTNNNLYVVPTRPQEIKTDIGTAYLGTGSILSTPPIKMYNIDYALGGSSHFKSRTITEHGTLYVDDVTGKPFLISDSVKDLSVQGLHNFFQENGRLFMMEQFKKLSFVPYPHLGTSSSIGIGYITTYDPRHKRLIISKKDYILKDEYTRSFSYGLPINQGVYFIDNQWKFSWQVSPGVYNNKVITLDNQEFFENKSWTLSYSFLTDSWVSFHSYLPNYLLNDFHTFYSNDLWKHNIGSYQVYFENDYPHIIDIIAKQNPQLIETTSEIKYCANSSQFDSSTNSFKDVDTTFNQAVLYNNYQSSGIQNIVAKSSPWVTNNSFNLLVDKIDRKYRLNGLYDYSTGTGPIWDSSWSKIAGSYYIDKVPSQYIDQSKSLFTTKRFKDYYLGIRLIYYPTQDVKITTDVINTIHSNNIR